MKIAVLSGKGGTGKTLVSVNLASVADDAIYLDCDVEEPNGHLFFKPQGIESKDITVKIPFVDANKCVGCRKCVEFCKFNALAYIKNTLIVFEEICHSCGGCVMFCPESALSERSKKIGEIREGMSDQVMVVTGIMNTGEASGVPIIKSLLNTPCNDQHNIFIDCPPGSACTVMESIKDADYCVLVAEPTVFGVHNLAMVYELVKLFGKPHGAVLNKCLDKFNPAEEFCYQTGISVLGRIPFDHQLGLLNSDAKIAARESTVYRGLFTGLLDRIVQEVHHEAAVNS